MEGGDEPLYPVDAETLELAEMCYDYSNYVAKYGSNSFSTVKNNLIEYVSLITLKEKGYNTSHPFYINHQLYLLYNDANHSVDLYVNDDGWKNVKSFAGINKYKTNGTYYTLYRWSFHYINGDTNLPKTNGELGYDGYISIDLSQVGKYSTSETRNEPYIYSWHNCWGGDTDLKTILKRIVGYCHNIRVYVGSSMETALPVMKYT